MLYRVRLQACARSTQSPLEVFKRIDLRLLIRESNDLAQPPPRVEPLLPRRESHNVLLSFTR